MQYPHTCRDCGRIQTSDLATDDGIRREHVRCLACGGQCDPGEAALRAIANHTAYCGPRLNFPRRRERPPKDN